MSIGNLTQKKALSLEMKKRPRENPLLPQRKTYLTLYQYVQSNHKVQIDRNTYSFQCI